MGGSQVLVAALYMENQWGGNMGHPSGGDAKVLKAKLRDLSGNLLFLSVCVCICV
jgi:hypothetical protein